VLSKNRHPQLDKGILRQVVQCVKANTTRFLSNLFFIRLDALYGLAYDECVPNKWGFYAIR
jgi:hypothetical protein